MKNQKDDRQARKYERFRETNVLIPYLLNIPVPGLGNCLYGRPIMGVMLMTLVGLAWLIFFAGGFAFLLGLVVIILSIIGAFFTLGLSLIFLPIGILMVLLGASPLLSAIMYFFSLIVSEVLVASVSNKVSELEESGRFDDTASHQFSDRNAFENYIAKEKSKADNGWIAAKILLGIILLFSATIIGIALTYFRPAIAEPVLNLIDNTNLNSGSSGFPEFEASSLIAEQVANSSNRSLSISETDFIVSESFASGIATNQRSEWIRYFLFVSNYIRIVAYAENPPWFASKFTDAGQKFYNLVNSDAPQFELSNLNYTE